MVCREALSMQHCTRELCSFIVRDVAETMAGFDRGGGVGAVAGPSP